MKKFLLPIVGLLLGSVAAQADDVSVKYYKIGSTTATELQEELFNPTTNELVKNEDGSYTLKKYQNSIYDLKFTIKDNVLAFPDIKTPGLFVLKDKDGQNCRFNLTTIKEYKDANEEMNQILVDGLLYSCINGKLNGVKLKSETFTQTQRLAEYEVSIVTYFQYKTPNGPDLLDTRRDYGAVVFNMTVAEGREGVDVAYQTASGAELFKNSFSPVEIGSDKSSKLSYFAGSEASLTFNIGNVGDDGKAPLVFTEGVSSADQDAYQTLAGATFSLETAAGVTKTGALAIRPSGCYATPIEGTATLETQKYNVYIDTKFGNESGYAVFEAVGPLAIAVEGEVVKMIYKDYTTKVIKEEVATQIIRINESKIIVKNYLNSGYDIPLVFTKEEVTGKDYFAQGTAKPTEEYIDSETTMAFRVKIPEDPTLVFTPVVAGVNIVNPQVYYYGNNGYVRYYNENGKIRTHVYTVFGAPWNIVEWDMIGGGDESGIADVVADENAPVEWYSLQGVRVNGENLAPGIYIKRQGSKAVKVLVK